MHDLVIRGGTLIDGSGAPARRADVAVDGGLITEVGTHVGAGRRELDARGLLVTPGFVDVHTHYDAQATWDPELTPSIWHGVTTVVMGSCGVGFAPARPDRHEWLIGLMEGVEDIPGTALSEGIRWAWESFPEYLTALEQMPRALDVGAQLAHGPLRGYVMGERGAANEPATSEDIAEMARLVREGLAAGALGFSTSRTMIHKASDGRPVPGTFATRDELFGLGRALRDTRAGVFQIAGEHAAMAEEVEWIEALAHEIGRPVTFNLSQIDTQPELWRALADRLSRTTAPMHAQVAGRAIGLMMSFDGSAHPFLVYPSFHGRERASLADPAVRDQILADTPMDLGEFANFIARSFDRMFVVHEVPDYEPAPDTSVAARAARLGLSPQRVAYDHLAAGGYLYFPLFNYADGNLDVVHQLHQHPRTIMGLGDAGAHCGVIADGGIPTFMLTHWTRDRTRGGKLPLEHVVHRQTRATAELFGLHDRGLIAPGFKADLAVIDYDRLRLEPTRMVYDLPAGGRRLIQRARGYVATVVSGTVVLEHDEPTGARPGKLIRGAQASPRG
jgi:N-acyl-D-aspartate/D-glutamate deacylase